MIIEKKAVQAYEKNKALAAKYQVADDMWMDWFSKGYKAAFDWVDIEDRNNPCPNDGDILLKLEGGKVMTLSEYEKLQQPALVTHWRPIEIMYNRY